MTESQAWEKIALAYYKPRDKRDKDDLIPHPDFYTYGICDAIQCGLKYSEEISNTTARAMSNKIEKDKELFLNGVHQIFICDPYSGEYDYIRADYCWLQKVIVDTGGI